MEYGPWQGGHHGGTVCADRRRPGTYSVFFKKLASSGERSRYGTYADIDNPEAARAKAEKRRVQVSIAQGLSKNRHRLVTNLATGEQYREMELTRGKTMFFDLDDLDFATRYTWYAIPNVLGQIYVHTSIKGTNVSFHTLLTGWPMVDHCDRDPSNNRRSNLRQTTHSDNARNRSQSKRNTTGYTGVVLIDSGYSASWTESDGKRHSKRFSWLECGKEEALRRAVEHRKAMEDKFYTFTKSPNDLSTLPHQPELGRAHSTFACPHCDYRSSYKRWVATHVSRKHPGENTD
jgi:hypothetical protein